MKQLKGKRALVTGAASGIGRAIAIALADQGTHLVLLDIDSDGLDETSSQTRRRGVDTTALKCDLGNREQLAACIATILADEHPIDILINNAGVAYYGPTDEMTSEQWSSVLEVNLHAPIQLIRAFLPTLKSRSQSHILNVSSVGGLVAGNKMAVYNASKFGLQGLTESLRAELCKDGVGVTAVCPGLVSTSIFENSHNPQGGSGIRRPPSWSMTTPEVVAQVAVKAIRRNNPIAIVTLGARLLWLLKRAVPQTFVRVTGMRFQTPDMGRRDQPPLDENTYHVSTACGVK